MSSLRPVPTGVGAQTGSSGVLGGGQPHAHPASAVQVTRLGCGFAKFAAQPGKVHVDGPVTAAVGLPPDLRQQVPLADHLTGALGQRQQQVELLAGQFQHPAVQRGRAGARVDDQATDLDRALGALIRASR